MPGSGACGHTALPNQNALKERISLPWADSNRRPPPVCGTNPTSDSALPTELHGIPYIFIRIEAHAGHYPCLRYFNIFAHSDIANLNPSVRSVNIRIPAAHSAFILSHVFPRPYTTTYLMMHSTRESFRVGTYLVSFGCTYGFRYRLFPLRRL